MPISTGVPSTTRKPGSFHKFDVLSGAKGLIPIARRVMLIGGKSSAGTLAAATPTQCFSERDGDTYGGAGSEAALMVRAAFKAAQKYGASPEIWLCTVADAGGSAAQVYTLTCTGTATASGDIVFRIAGRTLRAGIANGDNATKAGDAIAAAIAAAAAILPVTSANVTGTVTLTAVNKGLNSADIRTPIVDLAPAGLTVVAAAGASGTGAYDITASLDASVDKTYHATVTANHASGDVTKLATHLDTVGAAGAKRWSIAYLAEIGTLSTGTTLATGANRMDVVVITCEQFPSLPGEIAAQLATTVEAEQDPSLSFDSVPLDLPGCPASYVYIDAEIETALANGATPLSVSPTGQTFIVMAVTTKTSQGGAPFFNVLDLGNVRTLYYVANQVDAKFAALFGRAKKSERTRKRVRSVVLEVLKDIETLEIIQNVDQHAAELIVETDAVVVTRFNVGIPVSVIPALHQLAAVHTLFVE